MRRFVYIGLLTMVLCTCKKDKINSPEPYSKQTLYYESLSNNPHWTLEPKDTVYTPDTTCVKVENGLLQMQFDQPLNNCGCAWVGASYVQNQLLVDSFISKIGIRIKLKEGFFQNISTWFDTVDFLGHPCQQGESVSFSSLRLSVNCLDIEIPDSWNGRFQRDSTLNLNANKLVGKEFEIIYNKGKKIFTIDGVEQAVANVYFNWQNIMIQPLNIEFELGHLPILSPRIDKLSVDEIEIYTWKGDR